MNFIFPFESVTVECTLPPKAAGQAARRNVWRAKQQEQPVVRLCCRGQDIARMPVDLCRWLSPLLADPSLGIRWFFLT
jgi:hypothetical protein